MQLSKYGYKLIKHGIYQPLTDYLTNPSDVDQMEFHLAQHAAMNIGVPTENMGIIYVNTKNTVNGNGSILAPFNLIQSAINAAVNFTTIKITTMGDHFENIVMPFEVT